MHGGRNGVELYFNEAGNKSLCYVELPELVRHVDVMKNVTECCNGWHGDDCNKRKYCACFQRKSSVRGPQDRGSPKRPINSKGGLQGVLLTTRISAKFVKLLKNFGIFRIF